jgi:hypothetical protein
MPTVGASKKSGAPRHSAEMAPALRGLDQPGPYVVPMKWYLGYMSAPHTDRLSVVLSGVWWVKHRITTGY